jgi:hypothetical protein
MIKSLYKLWYKTGHNAIYSNIVGVASEKYNNNKGS